MRINPTYFSEASGRLAYESPAIILTDLASSEILCGSLGADGIENLGDGGDFGGNF